VGFGGVVEVEGEDFAGLEVEGAGAEDEVGDGDLVGDFLEVAFDEVAVGEEGAGLGWGDFFGELGGGGFVDELGDFRCGDVLALVVSRVGDRAVFEAVDLGGEEGASAEEEAFDRVGEGGGPGVRETWSKAAVAGVSLLRDMAQRPTNMRSGRSRRSVARGDQAWPSGEV
jgi:hypothetical protein